VKTLAVRMRYQNESAQMIAKFLEDHPAIDRVNYPGLESHPDHQRARALFNGFSGMLSFEVKGGLDQADRLIRNVILPVSAPSLGGVETLITRPATTSHSGMSPDDRQALGISDGLIRLSVGLEATEDLIEDLRHALEV
jgi:cystathionine beta-lyase/cystathionine gamma-synthase